MKRIIKLLFLALCLFSFVQAQNVKVITYNLRYDNPKDGENQWQLRKGLVTDLIKFYSPDVWGTQEGLAGQLAFLDSALTDYKHFGIGRDANGSGEHCAIFYNTKRFKLVKQSTFWLSETPDVISKGWDAALNRICTYGLLKDLKTKKQIWVFNTHFDHIGTQARINSAKLIYEKINSLNKEHYPVVLMGDFNLEPETEPIKYLTGVLNNTMFTAELIYGNSGTFNGFEFCKPVKEVIDYIFTTKKGFKALKYAVLTDSRNCRYLSDHLPVYAELKY